MAGRGLQGGKTLKRGLLFWDVMVVRRHGELSL